MLGNDLRGLGNIFGGVVVEIALGEHCSLSALPWLLLGASPWPLNPLPSMGLGCDRRARPGMTALHC
ncbi:hypothetical protein HC928_17000 [bacterium]|nr:hypothetical protein [bacterium]